MPSPTDVVTAGLRQSLAGVSRKSGSETNGEVNGLDIALAAGNKLDEITKHHVEFESADNQQCNTQNILKSKYIVLDTKHSYGAHSLNGSSTNGTKDPGCSNGVSNGNKSGTNGTSHPIGPQLNGMKGVHQNGLSYANVNGIGSAGQLNGVKKFGSNGHMKGPQSYENGSSKPVNSDSTLPEPKHVLYQPDKVTLGWKSHFRAGAGFVNLGNTCYLNATLQALFHVPAFVEWLLSDTEHMKKCEQINGQGYGDCITCSMARTLRLSQLHPVVKPTLITSKIKMICRHMSHGSQEDAHEFMRHLLENMEKAYLNRCKATKLDPYSKETTPINQIFGGYIRTEVKCLRCNYASTTFQHFQDLILDIRKASKVEDAMDQYFSKEKLDGENSYKCEKCKCGVPATKKYSIERPPKVLCIQLKRFNAVGVKLPKPVEHRTQMDLKRHVHPQSSYAKFAAVPYRLISMVTHVGPSSGCGHYTAIAQCSSRTFHHFDDTHVHPVSLQSVLNNCAYILIYEMEPQTLKHGPKVAATASISSNTALSQNNQKHLNGTNKNLQSVSGGLPSVKDRDRVTFGLTPAKPPSAQPRLVIHTKRPDGNNSLVPTTKPLLAQNGSMKEARPQNLIGPVQVLGNGKLSGSSSIGIMKTSDSTLPNQSDSGKREVNTAAKPEPEKKHTGSLVPYGYDDDSSSRDSSLSPPLNDDQEVLTVKATKPSDWQVTNSSGLRSPSIHSESSNHSVASATGTNWNVIDNHSVKSSVGLKTIATEKVKDEKTKEQSPKTTSYSSDPELDSQTIKSAAKVNLRAKSVERELNVGGNVSSSKHAFSLKKVRVRRSSLSSESDSSSSNKVMKKKAKMSDQTEDKSALKQSDGNKRLEQPTMDPGSQPSSVAVGRNCNGELSKPQYGNLLTWNGEGNSSTVNDLMKMSHHGFGNDRVASWNGEQSQVEKSVEEDRQGSYKRTRDEYEMELDRGRVKKVKKDYNRWKPYTPPFQHRPGLLTFNQNRKYNYSNPHHHFKNRPNHNHHRKWQSDYYNNKQPSNNRYYRN
ncbi:Ubiquitin carboxyl-terminal hydrolase 36 [Frankliniella fusca]|uniref:Ubiquitin carboxyl-terminal hydrolase 36 n=1 Tax=Frankliniella fusca TaxID=407009 RepID=A0AAE1HB50_9NEOP|nr:Ubiquitin carboxyl-terminal hydrolase 36 [Frankliniella fusca]